MLVKAKLVKKRYYKKDGTEFFSWKLVGKDGKLTDVRFRKTVEELPENSCTINVNEDDLILDNSKIYPCWWIKHIASVEEVAPAEKVNVLDYFEEVK